MCRGPRVLAQAFTSFSSGRLRPREAGKEDKQDKQIDFSPLPPQIGLGGLRSRPSCRGVGPLPSSRPRPKQCYLPLPLAFIRRVTWQRPLKTSPFPPLPSPLASPLSPPAAATGPLRGSWRDGVGARSEPGPERGVSGAQTSVHRASVLRIGARNTHIQARVTRADRG